MEGWCLVGRSLARHLEPNLVFTTTVVTTVFFTTVVRGEERDTDREREREREIEKAGFLMKTAKKQNQAKSGKSGRFCPKKTFLSI